MVVQLQVVHVLQLPGQSRLNADVKFKLQMTLCVAKLSIPSHARTVQCIAVWLEYHNWSTKCKQMIA